MRALCAVAVLGGQDALIKCLDELYPAYWVHGKATHEKEGLMACLSKALGEEMARKAMEMAPKEGKELLGKNTDQAFAEGAFGLPWFVAENSKGERDVVWGWTIWRSW
ncbi:hypothetical protein M7I_6597 [Glarea lozoyensis 74030]|nr:hypothetical protein M7I_6597 [Glarea lozoyensis 74030]